MPASDSSHIVTMVVVAVAVSAASILGGLLLWKKAGSTHSGTEADLAKVPTQIVHCPVFCEPRCLCARFATLYPTLVDSHNRQADSISARSPRPHLRC